MVLSPALREHKVVSLFSGCGGLDLGFQGGFEVFGKRYRRNPFRVTWANDLNPAACRTYRRNIGGHIVCGDIWETIEDMPKRADVLIGGFPCQDFSINGKRTGAAGERSGLYRAMVAAVGRTKPKVFIAENVKGLLQEYNRAALDEIIKSFKGLGYNVSYELYLAADYGVPQMRQRVFFVGTRPGVRLFKHPKPVLDKRDWMTAEQAISDLIKKREYDAPNHIWSRARPSHDQGSRKLKAHRPSDTIRAECHGNIQFHYKLDRRISMREAARIQSFPDDFVFEARLRETERQVGNAVPPVLAWHVARSVADCLE